MSCRILADRKQISQDGPKSMIVGCMGPPANPGTAYQAEVRQPLGDARATMRGMAAIH